MANETLRTGTEPSMASLMGDIIGDVQKLVRQELALARTEVKEEVSKAKVVAIQFGAALAAAAVGGLLLVLMLVHLLDAVTEIPLWGCYLLVGITFAGLGAFLFFRGKEKAKHIDFVPRETVQSIKENVQWIKSQT